MAISGQRIYVDTASGTGISVSEVSSVTGVSSSDVGTLCSSGVNKYAKFKPVKYAKWNPLYNGTDKYWYRGADKNCGLSLTRLAGNALTAENIKAAADWRWLPPTGGSAAPYRLLDFDGYRHDAQSPLAWTSPSKLYTNNPQTASYYCRCAAPESSDVLTVLDLMQYCTAFVSETASTKGFVGFVLVGGTDGRAYIRTKSYTEDLAGTDGYPIDIASLGDGTFAKGSKAILAPVIANIDTGGAWQRADNNTGIQVILFPSVPQIYSEYTLEEYSSPTPTKSPTYAIAYNSAPIFPSYVATVTLNITLTFSANGNSMSPVLPTALKYRLIYEGQTTGYNYTADISGLASSGSGQWKGNIQLRNFPNASPVQVNFQAFVNSTEYEITSGKAVQIRFGM